MNISVITVCFNSETTIADTLISVDSQTDVDIEHIIIDGASRDATLDVVGNYRKPWRHVLSEGDKGIYDAMNKGLHLARGDVIGFINSDDFYASSDVLATVAAAFAEPAVDACYGDLCYVKRGELASVVRYWRSSVFSPGLFLRGWCPPHPTFFVRKAVFERFGSFDLSYRSGVDVELMMRFLEVHRIHVKYIPQVLVMMRMGGTSNSSWKNILLQNFEILRAQKNHGLQPSLLIFFLGKAVSRCKQFLTRPS